MTAYNPSKAICKIDDLTVTEFSDCDFISLKGDSTKKRKWWHINNEKTTDDVICFEVLGMYEDGIVKEIRYVDFCIKSGSEGHKNILGLENSVESPFKFTTNKIG